MVSPASLFEVETAGLHGRSSWPADRPAQPGAIKQQAVRRADLLFASEILRSLRDGLTPAQRVLECSGFVEHWMIASRDDVYLLEGTVWRLPFSLSRIATPLLAIDPLAGWVRTVDEWLTISPCLNSVATAVQPTAIADRAARWLEGQLEPGDCGEGRITQN